VAISAGIVALFTIILSISTTLLWIETKRLAKVSADTAKAQSRQTRILERAYISVEALGIHPMSAGRSVAHIGIHNAGHLPASQVRWLVTYTFGPRRIETLPPLDMTKLRGEGGNVVVSGATMRQGSKLINYPTLVVETGFLFVHGIVTYHDGFEAGRETRFCHRYNRENALRDTPGLDNGPRIRAEDARQYHDGNGST
jgi:hypothetical protein